MNLMLTQGNALRIPLADESVHMVCCSPPYWGLRDYGTATWEGGDAECKHGARVMSNANKGNVREVLDGDRGKCYRCGALRIDNQLGLEPTPEQYVENMVDVFREVWRVLRPDGTLWLNMGDSYNGSGGAGGDYNKGGLKEGQPRYPGRDVGTLKPKDLCGIPWRVAFALQADGWWLRSDNPWIKNNPMPESADDRPNKCIEYMFLLTKSPHYYFDMDAVRVNYDKPMNRWGGEKLIAKGQSTWDEGTGQETYRDRDMRPNPSGRHWRNHDLFLKSIRQILEDNKATMLVDGNVPIATFCNTHSFKGAHFATYPPALVEPCIKAGTSERGVCPECGAPWERVVETGYTKHRPSGGKKSRIERGNKVHDGGYGNWGTFGTNLRKQTTTLGWRPTCECAYPAEVPADSGLDYSLMPYDPIPATVFDPFAGSGTTLQVARALGRNGVGLDLSLEYLHLARQRLSLDALEAWGKAKKDGASVTDLPMFAMEELDE